MRVVLAFALLLVVTGCQRSSHAPPATAAVAAPAPAASIAASPSAVAHGRVPAPSKKRASASADAGAKPGAGKQIGGGDQVGSDGSDPCAGLGNDDAIDDCLARVEAAAPDRAGSYRDATSDHPEIDPRDRALMDAEEADAVDGRQNGRGPDAQDQDAGSLPEVGYPPFEEPPSDEPPEDYPPDENADEPPAPDPYQR